MRDGPRRLTSTAASSGESKATLAAGWITTSHDARTARSASSRPSPSVPTSPVITRRRRATISSRALAPPTSARRRSKASLRMTSRWTRWAAVERRPARTRRTSWQPGTERSRRSTMAVPRKPVAPVTAMRLPSRASAITPSVYHVVSAGLDTPPDQRPHPRRRPRPVRAPGVRGHLARRPGRRAGAHQAGHPLLVPVEGGPARRGGGAQRRRPAGHAGGGLGGHAPGVGTGGDGDGHGVPLRRAAPGPARPRAGGEPARARGGGADGGGGVAPRAPGDRLPGRRDGGRHHPAGRSPAAPALSVRPRGGGGDGGGGAAGGGPGVVPGRPAAVTPGAVRVRPRRRHRLIPPRR